MIFTFNSLKIICRLFQFLRLLLSKIYHLYFLWPQQDLNLQPPDYESVTLTYWVMGPKIKISLRRPKHFSQLVKLSNHNHASKHLAFVLYGFTVSVSRTARISVVRCTTCYLFVVSRLIIYQISNSIPFFQWQ